MILRHEINLLCRSIVAADSISGELEERFYFDPSKFSGSISCYLEIYAYVDSGLVSIKLNDSSDNVDAQLYTPTGAYDLARSSAISPALTADEYYVYKDHVDINIRTAHLIIIQDTSTSAMTATEHQIEIGDCQLEFFNTSGSALTYPKYWYYDSSNWDGTLTCYAEVVWSVPNDKYYVTIKLQEDDGSWSWSDKVTIVDQGTSETVTRTRVSFTPTTGRHYRLYYITEGTKDSYGANIYLGKIIVQQTDATEITKWESQHLLINTGETGTGLAGFNTKWQPDGYYGLSYIDTDDQGDYYRGVWGDGSYIYCACDSAGLRSYSVDGSGNLTYIDTDDQGDTYRGVWGDGSYIYVACGTAGLRSYSVDGSGNLTYIDTDYQGNDYYSVWGDGSYIYCACYGDGLRSYSVDGSGNLTYIDTDDQGDYYRGVWGDGSYIYAACGSAGLRSYSVDGSGNLTYIDTDDQGGTYLSVWGDGTYIYVACYGDGLRSYSVDGSGNLTYIDTDDQGGNYMSVWGDGSYIYCACDEDGLRNYSVDSSGNLIYIDTDDQGGNYMSVWGDGTYTYAACYSAGLMSYELTPKNPEWDGVDMEVYHQIECSSSSSDGDLVKLEKTLDYNSTWGGTGFVVFYSGANLYGGQCFTGNGVLISSVKLKIRRSGSPTGSVYAKIFALTGTYGSTGEPTGSALGTSDALLAQDFSTGGDNETFVFSTPVSITSGNKYVLVFDISAASTDGANAVSLARDVPSTHDGNMCWSADGSSWTTSASDFYFYVYGAVKITGSDATGTANLVRSSDIEANMPTNSDELDTYVNTA